MLLHLHKAVFHHEETATQVDYNKINGEMRKIIAKKIMGGAQISWSSPHKTTLLHSHGVFKLVNLNAAKLEHTFKFLQ